MNSSQEGIVIRGAKQAEAAEIHKILASAFEPYRHDYTEEAYRATVVSVDEIQRRIEDKETEVLVATLNGALSGTVTVTPLDERSIYIKSMAVAPRFQGRRIASELLNELERIAKGRGCTRIVLECYEPLRKAVSLYEKFGFKRTGKVRPYHGIVVFEMVKEVADENRSSQVRDRGR